MADKVLEGEIADYLMRRYAPRSRDIHAAVYGQMTDNPTLAEVRAALQRMKARGEVRTAGHYAWTLTDDERARRQRAERLAWQHFDAKVGAGG